MAQCNLFLQTTSFTRSIIPIKSRRLASLSLCKGSEPMTSLSIVTPQISLKSSSAVETRRKYTICASQKSPILIRRLSRFRNFTSRFRMSVDNGSSNRSGDRIGAGDAVIIVDHGSRRRESNLMLNEFVAMFRDKTGYPIVEPAHMELAEPSIRDSFALCVEQGAKRIIVSPFFLFPGRHWQQDIPSLTAEAAKDHPGISYIITAPLGLHEKLVRDYICYGSVVRML
ncbi:sirohydrochlorin ferrochelatase, chloroplastic isoform X2 [Benincasa hispida]|uniref:sirohydrochlorin ferrochelatase, chloroplastic isoform X2 n=1 Tax=Benincasa hispida TaxID=102211 RepID=UPI0018FF2877|nr:sirohydrochlorin ferrochelatase, chloroplastic isoform X2 [Benincasa hispida]